MSGKRSFSCPLNCVRVLMLGMHPKIQFDVISNYHCQCLQSQFFRTQIHRNPFRLEFPFNVINLQACWVVITTGETMLSIWLNSATIKRNRPRVHKKYRWESVYIVHWCLQSNCERIKRTSCCAATESWKWNDAWQCTLHSISRARRTSKKDEWNGQICENIPQLLPHTPRRCQ